MSGAVGQTLECILVHGAAVETFPAFLADAGALSTEAVSGAVGMRAINWK